MKRSEKKLYTIDNPKKSNLLTFFAFLFCIYTLLPYAWLFINATKTQKDFASTFGLSFGNEFALFDNIRQVFTYHDGIFVRWLGNSIVYTVISAFVSTLLAALAGYALAKLKFSGKETGTVDYSRLYFCSWHCACNSAVPSVLKAWNYEYDVVSIYPVFRISIWCLSDVDLFGSGSSDRIAGSCGN